MTSKAYLIKRIEELEVKKKELEASESATAKTSPVVPCPTTPNLHESTTLIPGEPVVVRNVEPVPEELKHLRGWEIELLALDGDLVAQKFLPTRNKPVDFPSGPNAWMA